MNFVFLWYFLFPVLIVPWIWRLYRTPVPEQIQEQALCVPFFKQIQQEIKFKSSTFANTKYGLLFWLGWLFFVLAVMRPVSYQEGIFMPNKARQVILVLDVSGSMSRSDFVLNGQRISRLGAVKSLASHFINDRQGDAVGLTIFGTEPYVYIPLTQDVKTAQSMLQEVDVGFAGNQTAIGDALGLALKQMKNIPSKDKVIVLFSDGSANAGMIRPQEAIELAKKMNVKIYTVGLGLLTQHINQQNDLDEVLLQELASQTNGQYFRVKNTADLQKMYAELDKLEPVDTEGRFIRPHIELFWYPLGISMLFFLIGFFLRQRLT